MSDPVRLLDLDGDPMSAKLLRAGLDDAPPPGAKDAVFRSIQGALGVAVIAGAVGVAANATAGTAAAGGMVASGTVASGTAASGTAASSAVAAGTIASGSVAAGASAAVKTGLVKALVVKLGLAKTIGVVGLCSATLVGGVVGARELARDRSVVPVDPLVSTSVAGATSQRSSGALGSGDDGPAAPRDAEVAILDAPPAVESSPAAPSPRALQGGADPGRGSDQRRSLTTLDTSPVGASGGATPKVDALPPPAADTVAATPPAAPSGLSSESAGVTEVRAKLRAGDAGGALALLSAMQRQFGAGRMSEDRAVLTIDALAASGNTAAARASADAFLAAHPKSPFASRVRAHATP